MVSHLRVHENFPDFMVISPDNDPAPVEMRGAARVEKDLVYRDPAMALTIERAGRAARSDASVLIAGASGTGKEVLARYIHRRSSRSGRPFVAVNCAAIPGPLLESELFGHERGAFSGAISRRIGKFEAAHTGSLLLDEITEIELGLQAKLLRAIQEREIDRLGAAQPVRVDVRLLATTNRDIQQEVKRSSFREDLFYRLNVLPITIPDLKDRPLDIIPLAESFLARHKGPNGAKTLSRDAVARLHAYHWPGNVRELENVMHRASILSDDNTIGPDALEVSLSDQKAAPRPVPNTGPLSNLRDLERDAIMSMLDINGGNRTRTAAALGISIRTLRNKLHRYNLSPA